MRMQRRGVPPWTLMDGEKFVPNATNKGYNVLTYHVMMKKLVEAK
jgi:hypothetical protein